MGDFVITKMATPIGFPLACATRMRHGGFDVSGNTPLGAVGDITHAAYLPQ